ncbi:MAG TPA: hypothetical protein VFA05_09105 [Gaiellaceae bacterium]|nr:hypothetical protein [Gaiellaceae bacterium]
MLTVLQEKLAEAHGLAIAATTLTKKVEAIVHEPSLAGELRGMRADAEEARARCLVVEEKLPPELAEELRAHANTTHEKASDLLGAWFKAGTGPLRAWNFLAMGEAGEVATWSQLATLAARAGDDDACELAAWGLLVQQRHLETALAGAVVLAAQFDPIGPRWG